MKPLHIRMESFGSYKHENIDFAKVDHGIFLITGDTGAGKTTIFDGICYALFDCASGSLREKDTLRSHFAKDDIKTFVEFLFLFNGLEYKIFRSPAQTAKKLKGIVNY